MVTGNGVIREKQSRDDSYSNSAGNDGDDTPPDGSEHLAADVIIDNNKPKTDPKTPEPTRKDNGNNRPPPKVPEKAQKQKPGAAKSAVDKNKPQSDRELRKKSNRT